MFTLIDKVAIVTGASSGIGAAAARLFAQAGAAVVVSARRQDRLEALVETIRSEGGRAIAVAGDVCDPDLADRLVATATQAFGGLDIALNNAGAVGVNAPVSDLTLDQWRETVDVNLTGAFLGARAQIPALLKRGGGSLIFTSTFVVLRVGLPGMGAYAAAKAGLMGLVKGIAADYGARGIRANALLPGGTDTGMAGDQAQKDWAAGLHAMKRIAAPDEIANAALFLAGPHASFVTGSALYADGGNAAVK